MKIRRRREKEKGSKKIKGKILRQEGREDEKEKMKQMKGRKWTGSEGILGSHSGYCEEYRLLVVTSCISERAPLFRESWRSMFLPNYT